MTWGRIQKSGLMALLRMAWEAQVHPAIIAGRVRDESSSYRLLSQFVATGEGTSAVCGR